MRNGNCGESFLGCRDHSCLLCSVYLLHSSRRLRAASLAVLHLSALPSDGALGWQVCSNPALAFSVLLPNSCGETKSDLGNKIWSGKKKNKTVQPWVSCLLISYSQKVGWTWLTWEVGEARPLTNVCYLKAFCSIFSKKYLKRFYFKSHSNWKYVYYSSKSDLFGQFHFPKNKDKIELSRMLLLPSSW